MIDGEKKQLQKKVVEQKEREVHKRNERKHAPQLQNERVVVHSNIIV